MDNDKLFVAIITFIIVVITALVAFLIYGIYSTATAEYISIRKTEWKCTDSETRMTWTGKFAVPMDHCIEYRRMD